MLMARASPDDRSATLREMMMDSAARLAMAAIQRPSRMTTDGVPVRPGGEKLGGAAWGRLIKTQVRGSSGSYFGPGDWRRGTARGAGGWK